MAVLQVSWFDGEKYWDNNSVYYKTWLLKKHMIPFEKFEFLQRWNPILKIDRLWNDVSTMEDNLEEIRFPYVFDEEGARLFNNSLLWILWSHNTLEEKDHMNDSSEILFTEFDKYVKYNFDNNITVNYDEILLSLIHSSFLTWLDDVLCYDRIEYDNSHIDEVVAVIKRTSHLEKIAIDIINRYNTFTYGVQADLSFYDEMDQYQQRYEDMLSILQSALIQSLKFVFHALYNTLDDIEEEVMNGILTTYRQLILVSLACYYLQKLER